MKKTFFLFLLLTINLSNSQSNIDENIDWENPKNFENLGLKKTSSYSIKVSKNGKIKKDSLLLSDYNYDKSKLTISGTSHFFVMTSHIGTHLEFYNFKNNYSNDGFLLEKRNTLIKKEKENKEEHEYKSYIEMYEYDSLKRISKKTKYTDKTTIKFYKKDTVSYYKSFLYPMVEEYEYDSKNRIIKEFLTRDSTVSYSKYYNKKEFQKSKHCYSCESKYLNQEWNYDGNNLTKQINYAYENEVHTKTYYYYNPKNQLIRKIDSSGYYYTKPYLNSTTDFVYSDNVKTEIETKFDKDSYYKKETRKFNLNNQLIYEFLEAETSNYNIEREIEYSNHNKTITYKEPHNIIRKEVFLYDKRGLLIEKKEYCNEIISQLTRYYYE